MSEKRILMQFLGCCSHHHFIKLQGRNRRPKLIRWANSGDLTTASWIVLLLWLANASGVILYLQGKWENAFITCLFSELPVPVLTVRFLWGSFSSPCCSSSVCSTLISPGERQHFAKKQWWANGGLCPLLFVKRGNLGCTFVPLSTTRTSPLPPVLQLGLGFFYVIMHPKSLQWLSCTNSLLSMLMTFIKWWLV